MTPIQAIDNGHSVIVSTVFSTVERASMSVSMLCAIARGVTALAVVNVLQGVVNVLEATKPK